MTFVADSIIYENVGLSPARGRSAFEQQMRAMGTHCDSFEARTHAIAANGDVVLTERTDILAFYGIRLELWVCGTFEVRDGKITSWRDYFDWASLAKNVLRGVPGMLLRPFRKSWRAAH